MNIIYNCLQLTVADIFLSYNKRKNTNIFLKMEIYDVI